MAVVYARVAPKRDTKLNWSRHPDFVPFRGEIIIYMDYRKTTDDEGKTICIPGLKIGDGRTTVEKLPFIHQAGGGTASASAAAVTTAAGYVLNNTQLASATINASNASTSESSFISGVTIERPETGTNTFAITVPNGNSTVTFTFNVSASGDVVIS